MVELGNWNSLRPDVISSGFLFLNLKFAGDIGIFLFLKLTVDVSCFLFLKLAVDVGSFLILTLAVDGILNLLQLLHTGFKFHGFRY